LHSVIDYYNIGARPLVPTALTFPMFRHTVPVLHSRYPASLSHDNV
jgi:hypothetical protein